MSTAPPISIQVPPESTNPPSPDKYPVHVVEDDDAIRQLVLRYLGAQGYLVSTSPSAEEALEALARLENPVLVVDQNLPGMSGIDLVETLRRAGHDFEAVLMIAYADVDSLSRSLQLGFFRCLRKPLHNEDILSSVAGAANRLWLRIDLRARKAELEARKAELEARIKELREAQQQRLLGERLASIGRLAAGVAHEINSPLAAVIANLALMSEEFAFPGGPDLAQLEDMLRDARGAAERVRTIVRDMKTFSRADEERVGAVDLRRAIDATVNMVFNEIRHRARLVKDYGDTPPVEANEARLGQVILNLLLNAAQAIPAGDVQRNEIRIVTYARGDRVIMEIRDTGAGMPEAVRERIFDPFFTTKPIGVGTGLGLSISHGIVTGYGGQIEVDSEVGKGSVFRVTLPAASPVVASGRPARAFSNVPRGSVLVVDDDPAILRVLERVLGVHHEVVSASTTREALALLDAGGQFNVIICDLMMPEKTGMELHARVAEMSKVRADEIIFMSGGTFTPAAQAFLDSVINLRIVKPFDPDDVRRIVAERIRKA